MRRGPPLPTTLNGARLVLQADDDGLGRWYLESHPGTTGREDEGRARGEDGT